MKRRLLVTGANGFIGVHLCRHLSDCGANVRAVVRTPSPNLCADEIILRHGIEKIDDWSDILGGVDCVIHLAARVHVMKEQERDPYEEFRRINVTATQNLVDGIVRAGVKKIIFLSSVKVNGERTDISPFAPEDRVSPSDPYARSKLEAEELLLDTGNKTGLEVVIIRPPLVYGPGVKGNFLRLLKLVKSGLPLPFSGIENRRSMVSVFNLCDFLELCIRQDELSSEIFFVSDSEPLSITELLTRLAKHMDRKANLFKFSRSVLMLAAKLTGTTAEFQRLLDSLEVSIEKNRHLLGWTPPIPVDEGLRKTVEWYRENKNPCY